MCMGWGYPREGLPPSARSTSDAVAVPGRAHSWRHLQSLDAKATFPALSPGLRPRLPPRFRARSLAARARAGGAAAATCRRGSPPRSAPLREGHSLVPPLATAAAALASRFSGRPAAVPLVRTVNAQRVDLPRALRVAPRSSVKPAWPARVVRADRVGAQQASRCTALGEPTRAALRPGRCPRVGQ